MVLTSRPMPSISHDHLVAGPHVDHALGRAGEDHVAGRSVMKPLRYSIRTAMSWIRSRGIAVLLQLAVDARAQAPAAPARRRRPRRPARGRARCSRRGSSRAGSGDTSSRGSRGSRSRWRRCSRRRAPSRRRACTLRAGRADHHRQLALVVHEGGVGGPARPAAVADQRARALEEHQRLLLRVEGAAPSRGRRSSGRAR